MSRIAQREYKNGVGGIGPRKDSQMYKRFEDWYKFDEKDKDGQFPYREITDNQYKRSVFVPNEGVTKDVYSDPFYYNDVTLEEYYKNLAQDRLYPGMFEAIGRVTIYASQYLQNPFAKFIKDPLTSGNAHMAGLFKDIKSHEWYPGLEPGGKTYGVSNVVGNNQTSEGQDLSAAKSKFYDVPDTGWLFKAQCPQFVTTVSRLNFSREIALLVNAREYAKHCQTPEMVGEIGSALMGMSHAIYMNDMREASKNFFCGIVRTGPFSDFSTKDDYGIKKSTGETEIPPKTEKVSKLDNKMVEYVEIDLDKYRTSEEQGEIIADGITRIIHNTLEVDFADFSEDYNPSHLNRIAEKCTVVLDSHVRYDTFKKYYATLHHPEFIKPGPQAEFIWINEFPELGTALLANKDDPVTKNKVKIWSRLVGMIVDDNALAIIPYQTPVTVQTFFNPHKESMSIFTHYQADFEFKPFFNRKYIYLTYKQAAQ